LNGVIIAVAWAPRGADVIRIISVRRGAMKRKENIVRYTDKDLAAMEARGEDRTDWNAVRAKTEEQLAADMASDPAAWEGVPEDWVSRTHAAARLMGRPKENKRQVTMRFDADVLEFFKSTGRGWQGRMNAILRSFIERRGHRH
jgi:uncharacterized protein (DUF4415 family)